MADFSSLYDQADPRAYFRTLAPLDYRQPALLAAYLERHAGTLAAFRGKQRLRVLDFACGYGALGALLRHELTLEALYAYFSEDPAGEAIEADRRFFAARRKADLAIELGGLDIARRAIAYARACGLIDQGFVVDLTREGSDAALAGFLEELDLIVETGAVYDVIAPSFERLFEEASWRRPPWLLFGPRGDADTRPLERLLEAQGYHLELCSREKRPYRRFSDAAEAARVKRGMRALGRDPAQWTEGERFVNPLLLARPAEDAVALPVERLSSPS